jgi:predicted secreted hydrolase
MTMPGFSRRQALAAALLSLGGQSAFGRTAAADLAAIDMAPAPVPVEFPRDEAIHADFLMEWWYFTGHLEGPDGEDFGFEQVVFRGQRGNLEGFVSHAAMTDNGAETFQYRQEAALPFAVIREAEVGYDFDVRGLAMRGDSEAMRLQASAGDYAWDLQLTVAKPVVLHGGDGFVSNAAETETYYYSYTRIDVTGAVSIAGKPVPVTGEAWFDHQWFDTPGLSGGGWDWFSFQFDDRSELMLYFIKDASGTPVVAIGTSVAADGSFEQVAGDQFEILPTATWTSPGSGGEYPVAWTLTAPGLGLDLEIASTIPNQELDTRLTTGVTYWEGSVRVSGTKNGASIGGKGYVELTGYTAGDATIP